MKRLTGILILLVAASAAVYGQAKNDTIAHREAIQNIKLVFDDYIKYQESTDAPGNKELMIKSLRSLDKVADLQELEILINVWMYYDPTDFSGIPEIERILRVSRPQSIEAIKKRIANKKNWENDEPAPYSDLKNLLERLENE